MRSRALTRWDDTGGMPREQRSASAARHCNKGVSTWIKPVQGTLVFVEARTRGAVCLFGGAPLQQGCSYVASMRSTKCGNRGGCLLEGQRHARGALPMCASFPRSPFSRFTRFFFLVFFFARPPRRRDDARTRKMTHANVYFSHPREYGRGSREWYVHRQRACRNAPHAPRMAALFSLFSSLPRRRPRTGGGAVRRKLAGPGRAGRAVMQAVPCCAAGCAWWRCCRAMRWLWSLFFVLLYVGKGEACAGAPRAPRPAAAVWRAWGVHGFCCGGGVKDCAGSRPFSRFASLA